MLLDNFQMKSWGGKRLINSGYTNYLIPIPLNDLDVNQMVFINSSDTLTKSIWLLTQTDFILLFCAFNYFSLTASLSWDYSLQSCLPFFNLSLKAQLLFLTDIVNQSTEAKYTIYFNTDYLVIRTKTNEFKKFLIIYYT